MWKWSGTKTSFLASIPKSCASNLCRKYYHIPSIILPESLSDGTKNNLHWIILGRLWLWPKIWSARYHILISCRRQNWFLSEKYASLRAGPPHGKYCSTKTWHWHGVWHLAQNAPWLTYPWTMIFSSMKPHSSMNLLASSTRRVMNTKSWEFFQILWIPPSLKCWASSFSFSYFLSEQHHWHISLENWWKAWLELSLTFLVSVQSPETWEADISENMSRRYKIWTKGHRQHHDVANQFL